MKTPHIEKEAVRPLLETPYMNAFDLSPEPGRHYYEVSRRRKDDLIALKSDRELKETLPDAVSCFIIVKTPDEEPRLLLQYEYRYPAGRFLLGITAGLLDSADKNEPDPLYACARREIFEETGLTLSENDRFTVLSPFVFSTPGLTDESNALIGAVISLPDLSALTSEGEEGTECIGSYRLVGRKEAEKLLADGRDTDGSPYPLFCWCALSWFVSGSWEG